MRPWEVIGVNDVTRVWPHDGVRVLVRLRTELALRPVPCEDTEGAAYDPAQKRPLQNLTRWHPGLRVQPPGQETN